MSADIRDDEFDVSFILTGGRIVFDGANCRPDAIARFVAACFLRPDRVVDGDGERLTGRDLVDRYLSRIDERDHAHRPIVDAVSHDDMRAAVAASMRGRW
jgi:hypothetical protein